MHSLAGFNLADELITRPPYSASHHSASMATTVAGSASGGRGYAPEPGPLSGNQGFSLVRRFTLTEKL